MDIYCYKYDDTTGALVQKGIIDNFISFSFPRSYTDIGEFQLVIDAYSESAKRIKDINVISFGKSGKAGIILKRIEELNTREGKITYIGVQLKGIAAKRLVVPPAEQAYLTFTSKSPEYIIAQLLDTQIINPTDDARAVGGVILPYTESETTIDYNGRYSNLADDIIDIATTYNIGWEANILNGVIYWRIYKGVDRTRTQSAETRFLLSYGVDSIGNSSITQIHNIPSYLLIAGQGEGTNRTIIPLDDTSTGLSRTEVFTDARDVSDSETLLLRGLLKLADYGDSILYSATLSPYVVNGYEVDFNLGDIATLLDSRLPDGEIDYRLSEIIEVYESGMLRLDAKFGYDNTNLKKRLKRMANSVNSLLLQ